MSSLEGVDVRSSDKGSRTDNVVVDVSGQTRSQLLCQLPVEVLRAIV
jgi:hypothetical protein